MPTDIPSFQATPLRCQKCGHEWTGYIATNCPMSLALASIDAITTTGCPSCRAKGNAVLLLTEQKLGETGPSS